MKLDCVSLDLKVLYVNDLHTAHLSEMRVFLEQKRTYLNRTFTLAMPVDKRNDSAAGWVEP